MIFWGQRLQFLWGRPTPLDVACSSQTTQPVHSQELLRNAFHLLGFCSCVSAISNGQSEGTTYATTSLLQFCLASFRDHAGYNYLKEAWVACAWQSLILPTATLASRDKRGSCTVLWLCEVGLWTPVSAAIWDTNPSDNWQEISFLL